MKMALHLKLITTLLVMFTGCHGNTAYEGGVYLKDAVHMWSDQSAGIDSTSSLKNVSDVCHQDFMKLFSEVPILVQVLDSFGKPTPGTLVGNTAWFGHFDECMNITDFRYCLADMRLNVTFNVSDTSVLRWVLPISWGVCAPVSCSEDDVQNGLEILLDLHNVSWIGIQNVTGSAVHCTEKPNTDFDAGFIGTIILISILSILSVVGTILDRHIAHKQNQRPSSVGQSSSQRSTSAQNIYTTSDKGRGQIGGVIEEDENDLGQSSRQTAFTNDPDSIHTCIDIRSDRRKGEEAKGQRSNDKLHLPSSVEGYGATWQKGGTYASKAGDSEVHITSGPASEETTALLAGSHHSAASNNKPKNSLWVQFLLCFSISRNLPLILGSQHAPGSIQCLNGIRVISLFWVILYHCNIMMMQPSENVVLIIEQFIQDFTFQVLVNQFNAHAVDTFFVLGGLLLSYLTLKKMKQNNGKVAWGWLYFHRYIRLTPILAMVILGLMFIIPNMVYGPASYKVNDSVNLCRDWWWTDLLYINNFVPNSLGKDCIHQSWYLANDMQFLIISPLLLIPMYRYGVKGMIVLIMMCVASFITTAMLCYQNDFVLFDLKSPAGFQAASIYIKPYCRIPPYLLGMALGYVMYDIGKKKIKLSPVIVAAGWAIASALGIAVVYGLYDVSRGASIPTQAANIMYLTFSRFTWALAVSWVIFACHYGYGGVVNDILSWNFWVPLGRLNYVAYIIHVPIIKNLYSFSIAVPIHWSVVTLSYLYAAFVLLSYCCALVLCVLVEFPFCNMEKILQTRVKSRVHRQPVK